MGVSTENTVKNSAHQGCRTGPRSCGRRPQTAADFGPTGGCGTFPKIRKFDFQAPGDKLHEGSATAKRRFFRRRCGLFRKGFHLKTGSDLWGSRLASRSQGPGGDLLTRRPISDRPAGRRFSPEIRKTEISEISGFRSRTVGEHTTFRRSVFRLRRRPLQERVSAENGVQNSGIRASPPGPRFRW